MEVHRRQAVRAAAGLGRHRHYYNTDALAKAGYQADVAELTWNPDDGGTFGKMVAHLTIDKNDTRGDQPGFDKSKVAQYGFGRSRRRTSSAQTTWAPFVSTLGWRQGDKTAWPTKFNYADPRFTKTMKWVRGAGGRGVRAKARRVHPATSEVEQTVVRQGRDADRRFVDRLDVREGPRT